MSGFDFDRAAFDHAVNKGVRKVASTYQRLLDDLAVSQAGKPLEEVKAALLSGWRHIGGELTDPELTRFAQLLGDGHRIELRTQQI